MHHITLICPDHSPLKESEKWLSKYGFQVSSHFSIEQAKKHHKRVESHLFLIDYEVIRQLDDLDKYAEEIPHHIVLDAKASLSVGVNSMAQGASYYLPLPTNTETLLKHVVNTLEQNDIATSTAQNTKKKSLESPVNEALPLGTPGSGIIGQCPLMQDLFSDMRKIAKTNATVLIRGESGTGKELIAKALHHLSQRHSNPIVSVNCAAIPENLIESELFGHEKGAFTGATTTHEGLIQTADKGTLFLDEIGELPLEAQARLLRVLQEGEVRKVGATTTQKVDIRIVTATHRDLMGMVEEGRFREDLYYRLYVMELLLPPLRDREKDISLLAKNLVEKACLKHNIPPYHYSKAFDKAIHQHNWPGNVRELENAIERAVILSPPERLEAANLKLVHQGRHTNKNSSNPMEQNLPTSGTTLDDYLKHFVLTHQDKFTETQIAHSLGISRKSLWERRQKLNIPKK